MNIAVIPARGGSKRIPGKNIKSFCGAPMISYAIKAARKARVFDSICVLTDSEEIAEVARNHMAHIPFLLPDEMAQDIGLARMLKYAIPQLLPRPKFVCSLMATCPFLQPDHIRTGLNRIQTHGVSSVFTITTFSFPILRALKIKEDGHLEMFWPEHEFTLSQDLPEAYHDAAHFYWLDAEKFLVNERIYADDALPLIIPRHLVQDVDVPEDWKEAELMYRLINQEETR